MTKDRKEQKTHLAICTEPFLSLMLNGKKKVESRFSKNKIAPYEKVSKGDSVLLKRSGGGIEGFFVVQKVLFTEIKNKKDLDRLKKEYSKLICSDIDSKFWQKRIIAKYATFIWIGKVSIKKQIIKTTGRSGWRILK
ncbi:MAG: hypothetical protein NTW62_02630 [Candidatus Nomurabacteria bacterium]|nr:hypothetical protein [Candidatus Nomurabacteria bacterium]